MQDRAPHLTFLAGTDIYLIDQILKGHATPSMRVFDGGCGGGRNLRYFLAAGAHVRAIDPSPDAIAAVRELASQHAGSSSADDFRAEPLEAHSFPDAWADLVICNAVLHFARDEAQFDAMLEGAWRSLTPGGLFFARLASSIGIEKLLADPTPGWRQVPDGSQRFLVDAPFLERRASALGATWAEPLKTTVVHGQRSMTTWVLRKRS